eukprot:TRINITY_DN16534_c0_g2_i1.p1 TRINITY_DN16534_c0_g2~~TRINITY_DN16534_c0_g2_i1.p1  ORF type:complete len:497 (+),score=75.25 TRINITY_DN16534_c0_g2_i1:78-1493(+)
MANVATKELSRALLALVLLYLAATVHLYRSMMGGGACGHGYLDASTGECVCQDRYAGQSCKLCRFGLKGAGCWSGEDRALPWGDRERISALFLINDTQAEGSLLRWRLEALATELQNDQKGYIKDVRVVASDDVDSAVQTHNPELVVLVGSAKNAVTAAEKLKAQRGAAYRRGMQGRAVVVCWLHHHAAFAAALGDHNGEGSGVPHPAALPRDLCDAFVSPSEVWLSELTWRRPVLHLPLPNLPLDLSSYGFDRRRTGNVVASLATAAGLASAPVRHALPFLDIAVVGDYAPGREAWVHALVPVTRTTGEDGYRKLLVGRGWGAHDARYAAAYEQHLWPFALHSDAPEMLGIYASAKVVVVFSDDAGFEAPPDAVPTYIYDAMGQGCVVVRVVPSPQISNEEAYETFWTEPRAQVSSVATPAELRREVATLLTREGALEGRLKMLRRQARGDGVNAAPVAAELLHAYAVLA